jgi:6-phospho-3-hexuloisomerase
MVNQMAQIADRAQANIVFVTYSQDTPVPTNGNHRVLLPVDVDRDHPKVEAVQHPLGTLFEQTLMLYLDMVVYELMKRQGVTEEQMAGRHTNLE